MKNLKINKTKMFINHVLFIRFSDTDICLQCMLCECIHNLILCVMSKQTVFRQSYLEYCYFA